MRFARRTSATSSKSTYENYYGTVIDSILAFAAGKPVNVLNPEALEKK